MRTTIKALAAAAILLIGQTSFAQKVNLATQVTGVLPLANGGTGNTSLTVSQMAAQAANTVVGNVTGSSASPTAVALPSCADTGGNHLNYISGTGFTCGTSSSGGGGGGGALTDGQIFVGNGSNVATSVAMTGDVSITNTGVTTVNTIGGQAMPSIGTLVSHCMLYGTGASSIACSQLTGYVKANGVDAPSATTVIPWADLDFTNASSVGFVNLTGGYIPLVAPSGVSLGSGTSPVTLPWIAGNTPVTLVARTTTDTLTNKTLTRPQVTVQACAATATPTWDMALGNMCTVALSAVDITAITVTNPPTGGSVSLRITQDTSPRAITWPNGDGTTTLKVRWPGGTAPTLSAASGAVDLVTCNVFSQFVWHCSWQGAFQ